MTVSMFRVPETIATDLAKALQDEIVFCNLAPGLRLTEEEIVRRYNVSRSPVREALRLLSQDGLIVMERRRGARVSPVSVNDLDEVYRCRLALETLAAELAAESRRDEDVVEMNGGIEALRAALVEASPRSFFQANVRVSDAIYKASHNATLQRLLANIGKQALRYRYIAYLRNPELMNKSVEYNVEIVNAIANQLARHARSLTEDVLKNSWKSVREQIDGFVSESACD